MDRDLAKKLDRIISLQEDILKELRKDQKVKVSAPESQIKKWAFAGMPDGASP